MKLDGIVLFGIYALGVLGWILNLVKIFDSSDGELVFRVIALIIAPLGSIVGYF